jgi:glycosyltransferase involved in cell wall biosynthesis
VITLDDDLQHRPEDVPALLDYAIDHDFDVVFGVSGDRQHAAHRNLASKLYLWFFRKATECSPNITATSFRVMNQRIVERLVAWRLRQPQASYMILRLTSNVGNLAISHESRKHGASGVSFARALRLGIDSLLYFSSIPLRFAIYLAALISVLGMGLGAFYVFAYFTGDSNLMGYTSMVLLILAFGSMNLLMTASVGLYVSRVMNEVVAQPAAAVRNSIVRSKEREE